MSDEKHSTSKRVKALVALRPELDSRMGSNAGVIGSMIGVKLRAGLPTGQVGITYFVHEKLPISKLSPRQRVPARLRIGDDIVTTDVEAWPRMTEQMLPRGTILFDGRLQGTLSCFAMSKAGVFGVSCAHCLTGVDGNPATPTAVEAYANPPGQFLPVGESVYLAYSPGMGVPGNFGYLDCGLFNLRDKKLASRAYAGRMLDVVSNIYELIGCRVSGISALNAPHADGPQREAQVVGVEAQALGERCDVVLHVQPPGTFKGDSGMLWLTDDGRAAAIHARGQIMDGMQGSRRTTAMSTRRVIIALGVQLTLG